MFGLYWDNGKENGNYYLGLTVPNFDERTKGILVTQMLKISVLHMFLLEPSL